MSALVAETIAKSFVTGSVRADVLRDLSIAIEPGEPLRLEIVSFLDAVRNRTRPVVSGEDGRVALELALEINRAIAAHAERAGLVI